MENVTVTRFIQEISAGNGQITKAQVVYSTYEGDESFSATVSLSEADDIADMTRLNVTQADNYARKKLRELLTKPGIVQLPEEEAVEAPTENTTA